MQFVLKATFRHTAQYKVLAGQQPNIKLEMDLDFCNGAVQ